MTQERVWKGAPMNPLRQRYIDDLRLRNFSPSTIKVYVHAVARFAQFLSRSPVDATGEDLRRYLVAEIDRGMSRSCTYVHISPPDLEIEFWPTEPEGY